MRLKLAEAIVEMLEEDGLEGSVRADYSGRGMYGKTTAAVIGDDVTEIVMAAGRVIGRLEAACLKNCLHTSYDLGEKVADVVVY